MCAAVKHLALILLPILSLLLLISCSEQESSAQKAARDGILLIGNNSEPQSLDPHKATAIADGRIISSLFEGLVRPSPEQSSIMLPGVAQSWQHNEDASIWTFNLRPEARWSDGRPVTASDFAYAYRRLLHPEFGGKYAEMLYPLKGAASYNQGHAPWEQVGVKVIDSQTLQLSTDGPCPHLLQLMLHHIWYPLPAHVVEAHGGMLDRRSRWTDVDNWVSNGAYTLKEHRYNNFLEVAASPSYWRKQQLRNRGIRFLPIVNGFTETRMFFDGKLHISNNVPPEMISYARAQGGSQFKQTPYYNCIFYRINCTSPPLNDLRVRRALSLAINRDALVNKVVRGAGRVTNSFTPPSSGYHVETPKQPATQAEREELARELLAEAGYPDGKDFPSLEIMSSSREVQRIMAESVQAFWLKALGIRVDIRSYEWTAYKAAQQNRDYQISSSAWSGDFLDPATFVELWRSGGGNNNTGWGDPELDAALNAARRSQQRETRMSQLAQAEQIMLRAQPIIPLYWSERCYLVSPMVSGLYPSPMESQPLDAVKLNPEPPSNKP